MDSSHTAVAVELIELTLLNTSVAAIHSSSSSNSTEHSSSSDGLLTQFPADLLDTIADALVENGYLILRDVIPTEITEALRLRVEEAPVEDFRFAAIGRGAEQQLNHDIRSDRIRWLAADSEPDNRYLALMESLREGLNQRLFMGLFDYESHYAWYRPGAFYQKHLDALRGSQNRILTTVFFLNHDWQAEQGGELKLYDEDDSLLHTVLPEFGTLVIFLSERFPHEVCPTERGRGSIAGWFRVSNSHYGF